MTPADFRHLALALPGSAEGRHMEHADFRVGGRVFASLGYPDDGWGMVKLSPDDQAFLISTGGGAFAPAAGAWGRAGSTVIHLQSISKARAREALLIAHAAAGRQPPRKSPRTRGPAMSRKPTTIDQYLAALDSEPRAALEKLRRAIRAAAPRAEECISYRLPAFRLDGRMLVGFGAAARHCAFYPMSATTVAAHRALLENYDTSEGTIRFPASKPLPATLIRRLVKARIAENAR